MKSRIVLLSVLALLASVGSIEAQVVYTGCLKAKDGTLYNVQQASVPKAPCAAADSIITWNQQGPQGPAGPQGPQGMQGPPAPGSKVFRFVGVTDQVFQGNAGLAAMSRACNGQFPGARMAFTDEYRTTVNPPDFAAPYAWIQPRPILEQGRDGYGNPQLIDVTGLAYRTDTMDCDSWSNNNSDPTAFQVGGIALLASGAIGIRNCSSSVPVACAAAE